MEANNVAATDKTRVESSVIYFALDHMCEERIGRDSKFTIHDTDFGWLVDVEYAGATPSSMRVVQFSVERGTWKTSFLRRLH